MTPRILIADDERDVVELLKFHLLAEGFEVETAGDGMEALDKARTAVPDAIILDWMMPELDGKAVCEMLRRLPTTSAIPVLMLTAQGSDSSRLIALQAGVTEYLTKPFSPRELVSRVRNVLRPATMRSGDGDFPELPPGRFQRGHWQ